MRLREILFLLSFWAAAPFTHAQISPPGLDDTNTALWGAVGMSQSIYDRWNLTVYGGAARQSSPDDYNPFLKQAIAVLNEELQYKFTNLWAGSLCTSFRIQNRYEHLPPYAPADPDFRNEFRLYGRLYYRPSIGSIPVVFSFRPEYRHYQYDHEEWTPVNVEVRLRLKGQISLPLNQSKSNQIILADEVLAATDHVAPLESWTHWEYTEDRLSTYFRHTFAESNLLVDLGMMHQFRSDGHYIAHFAFDFIFVDPFGHPTQ